MPIRDEAMSFSDEAEVRMQDLAEFLARDTRVNLAMVSQLYDNKVLLTPGAFLMLVIPLIEAAQAQERRDQKAGAADIGLDPEVIRDSISRLLQTMKQDPSPADLRFDASDVTRVVVQRKRFFRKDTATIELGPRENVRSSLSVIQAYWKRFCSIPPFCGSVKASS